MLKVLKFGGTSVGSLNGINNIRNVLLSNTNGVQLVVVSAASKSTDMLQTIVDHLQKPIDEYHSLEYHVNQYINHEFGIIHDLELEETYFHEIFNEFVKVILLIVNSFNIQNFNSYKDLLLSYGEYISMLRICKYLSAESENVICAPSWDLGFITDSNFGNAKILETSYNSINTKISEYLNQKQSNSIIITTGFVGKDIYGNVTTIGRGGGDVSASIFAVALKAESIEIWSDVPGIMTCDPKIVSNAKLITELSYAECIELSFYGAKILHPKTVQPLSYYNIPLYIKNTFDPESPGTKVIKEKNHHNETLAVGISYSKNNTIININGKSLEIIDLIYICNMLSKYCNYFNMISLTKSSISIALKSLDPTFDKTILEHLSVNYVVNTIYNISIVSVVGQGLSNTVGIASKLFSGISSQHINIEMISQSAPQTNITFAVKDEFLNTTLNSIHYLLFT